MPWSRITACYLWGPLQKVGWHCLGGITGLKLLLTNTTYSLQQSCTTADNNHNLYNLTSPHLKLWPYFQGRKVNHRNAVDAAVEVSIQDWRSHQVQATLKTFYWSNNLLFIYSFFISSNGKNPWGQSIKLSRDTDGQCNPLCVSIVVYSRLHRRMYLADDQIICAAELWKIILRVEYNKGDDKQSLREVCTYQSTKNKLPRKSL